MNKFLTKRNIFIVLSIVVLIEVIWAVSFLLKPAQRLSDPDVVTQITPEAFISLTSLTEEYKIGEKFMVDVNINSAKKVDGVDLIIKFDPQFLTAEKMTTGTIFSDYPQNEIDPFSGKISVSGISTQTGGIVPSGEFGKMTFLAKRAGSTFINIEFAPGGTIDTNVIESGTGNDILEKVSDLEVNIK